MNGFFQKFRRDVAGIAWLSTTLFLGLALFSFRPTDPSFNSTGVNLQVYNYCGYIGSFVADLVYQLLGLSAWVLVVGGVRMCVRTFKGESGAWLGPRLLWGVLLLITAASLFALHLPATRIFGNSIPIGGILGTVVSKGLISAFNFLGVSIILWSLALLLLVFYTERPLKEIFKAPLAIVNGMKAKFMEQLAAFRASFSEGGLKPQAAGAAGRISLPSDSAGGEKKAKAKAKDKEKDQDKDEEKKVRFLLGKGAKKNKADEQDEEEDEDLEDEEEEDEEIEDGDEESEEDDEEAEAKAGGKKKGLQVSISESDSSGSKETKVDVPRRKVKLTAKVERRIENWKLPDINMIDDPPVTRIRIDEREITKKAEVMRDKLAQFSVKGEVVHAKPGPAVTMYEFKPNADVKISKITDLADDLSLALSSESVRIIAPIPGRDVVGIETSNSKREIVYLKDILANDSFWADAVKLPICLGRQADGEPKVVDLRKMPHLMVAGTTGSGKSVFVVSAILGLLFKHSPKSLRLILVDPKQVDLATFNNIPHLLMPPIREPKKAVTALKWAVREMEKRYRSMSKFGARGLESYNEIVGKFTKEQVEDHEKLMAEWENDVRKLEQYYFTPQPYIVIVIEEFADLMAVDKQNVENLVVRLAQMARACGIHLVLATQSPRKDVVTGLIKTNIPGRISFKVASKLDSRIILDEGGAERLLPNGDSLYLAPGVSKPQRHHAPWITEPEIANVIKFWADQGEPAYDLLAMRALEGSGGGFDLSGDGEDGGLGGEGGEENEYDERYDEILSYVSGMKEVSASLLQRKFKLGYPRAARMIEIFEREGVVGPANGSKPRPVLVNSYKDN
jgi:S-DNA-T family DNA segregation ATPase FtsK/SpoIIIE